MPVARGITHGPPIAPVWYALTVPPQRERATQEHLRAAGVTAFYPSEEKTYRRAGKLYRRTHPIVSRHVYAQFRQEPQWDVMKEYRRLITGVFSIGCWPVAIPKAVIQHLQGMTVEAQKLKEAREEMLRVRAGDKARITEGPLNGFMVDVEQVTDGRVWFKFITGGKGSASVEDLERVLPETT